MTRDWDNPRLLKASYQGETFTLSPSMTLTEFRKEVLRINKAVEHVAIERGRFEAQRAKVAS